MLTHDICIDVDMYVVNISLVVMLTFYVDDTTLMLTYDIYADIDVDSKHHV
jgi:hypothetical protein